MWLIIFILLVIFLVNRRETFNVNLEKLPYIRENNIQLEQFASSHTRDIPFTLHYDGEDELPIADLYDALVDDGRAQASAFQSLDTHQPQEYFTFANKADYGASNFSNY